MRKILLISKEITKLNESVNFCFRVKYLKKFKNVNKVLSATIRTGVVRIRNSLFALDTERHLLSIVSKLFRIKIGEKSNAFDTVFLLLSFTAVVET